MTKESIREQVRVMFHLNGYTKVLVEETEGVGLADGGILWEISTEIIPPRAAKDWFSFHS